MAKKAGKSKKKSSSKRRSAAAGSRKGSAKRGGKARKTAGKARKGKRASGGSKARSSKRPAKKRQKVDPRVAEAMKQYDEAVQSFNRKAYRRARELFAKVLTGVSPELAERAQVHIAICDQQLEGENHARFRTVDEHYDYAVAQINVGELEDARVHLKKAIKMNPKADHVHYALAAVSALSGKGEEAMEYLEEAIRLRPENRFQARNDADFESLHDDLGFQQLVFPERFPAARGRH